MLRERRCFKQEPLGCVRKSGLEHANIQDSKEAGFLLALHHIHEVSVDKKMLRTYTPAGLSGVYIYIGVHTRGISTEG